MIEMIMMMAFVLFGVWAVKPYSESSIKEKIRQDMDNPLVGDRASNGERIGDPWWLDRFNWLLNGSYGEEHYTKWLKRLKDAIFNQKEKKEADGWPYLPSKRLKSAVIEAFQVVMALEYSCTRGHFVNCLKAAVPADIINEMTYLLMREAINHVNEHIEASDEDREQGHYHVWISDDHGRNHVPPSRIYEAGCN
jgi:hypothetical protein